MAQANPDAHIQHRCAVCWEFQATHNLWRQHAEDIHGAEMLLFGYGVCRGEHGRNCAGVMHVRLKHEGRPPVRKWTRPQPVKAKDGTTYTPLELPI